MVDKISLYWTDRNSVKTDITKFVSNMKWSESSDRHTMELSFTVPDVNERYLEHYTIEAGDKLQLLYNNEVKYCFVVIEAERDYPKRSITAKDFCWYLERNEDIIIQFLGISCKKACELVCNELGVSVDSICNMPATVNGVYIDSAENIIEEILEIQKLSNGKSYSYEMNGSKLRIYELPTEAEKYKYKDAENVAEIDVTEHHSRCKYKHSIEDMVNSVTAIIKSNTDGNLPAMEYTISDSDSVKRYGRLGGKIEVSADKQTEIEVLAKNELKEKGEIKREISCEMMGAINARVNRVMPIVDEYTGISAVMRITDVEHTLEKGIYKMEVSLKYLGEYEPSNISTSKIQREKIDLNGKSATYYDSENSSINFNKLYSTAQKYLGVPYVWGGYSPKGFDCSGFVCYVLNESGVWSIGRTTAQGLYNSTKRVKSPKAGDLIFWTGTNPNSSNLITHVGICIGNGKNIQAGGSKVHIGSNGGAYAYGRFLKEEKKKNTDN